MLLAIDIGNSTISFGIFEGEIIKCAFKAESRKKAPADEYSAFIRAQIMSLGIPPEQIDGAVISSVAPALVHVFFDVLKTLGMPSPLLVSSRLKLPIKIKYRFPDALGSDRIAAASAGFIYVKGPIAVLDFGTATTISVVDSVGDFLGGTISPGLITSYEALINAADGLPRIGLAYPKKPVGEDTAEGLESGVILGHASMSEGLLIRAEGQLGVKLGTLATGGLAQMVVPHMARKTAIDPYLTLKGLAIIHKLNIDT
ncbi:MAG: type III pantothenate kinase [Nitrospirota bacterium]